MPLFLLARIADEAVVFDTSTIGAVVELGPVTPVPRAPRHVRGLCALRSRVLTVVDGAAAIGRTTITASDAAAVTIDVGGHGYALLVDAIDDVIEAPAPEPIGGAVASEWAPFARGLVSNAGETVLLVDPAALIDQASIAARDAANRTVTAPR